MKRVHVAAAVIRDNSGKILIARRADTQHQGGLWEFPGGKVEADESVETALARELHEELGIVVSAARPLIKVRHDYPDKQVLLDVWEVSAFTGEPHGAEGQPLEWVAPRDLLNYEFPAANQPIVAAARLPAQYLITPEDLETPALAARYPESHRRRHQADPAAGTQRLRSEIPRSGGGCGGAVCRQGAVDDQGAVRMAGRFPVCRLAHHLSATAQVCGGGATVAGLALVGGVLP